MTVRVAGLVLAGALAASPAAGQGYRLRVDARLQTAAYRGVTLDSIPVIDTITGPTGGPISPDSFAVQCDAGAAYCRFWRPGPEQSATPFTALADLVMWGLGLPGLSARGVGRFNADLAGGEAWPGTEPGFELLEGYAEYAHERVTGRLGRQLVTSRFGVFGFDGAGATYRVPAQNIEVGGYAGWGLGQAAALPVSSPVLNPLDEFRPRERLVIAGLSAGWRRDRFDARAEYQREVDPEIKKLTSERAALAATVRPLTGLTVALASDWDLAFGAWGSAEATATYARDRVTASAGGRRYRPHLPLWTIWGAFSPVPYSAWWGSVAVTAAPRLTLRGRAETYQFAPAEVSTALVNAEDDGYRFELGGTWSPRPGWTADAGYHREFGPGAASAGWSGAVTYAPEHGRVAATLYGASLVRPLEFRFNEAAVTSYGIDADLRASERTRIVVGAARYNQEQRRPDAAAFDWNQWRLSARLVLLFGSGGELDRLPPAIRRLPGGRSTR